ncbi:hypothetical protein F4781DRAFT_444390 [Annulohypoxylon bovei var. microspora]|nr:hypothetical protein F4781DRAFT_444390 [Annulohypoxylon bovei var. microspora]
MKANTGTYFFTCIALILGCIAGGCSYFAAFVNNELRPYFIQHDMGLDSSQAHEIYTYLIVSAVFLWLSCLGILLKVCIEDSDFTCARVLFVASGLTIVTMAAMIAKYAWNWREYFDAAEGLDHLAMNCHTLAGMCTANMVIMFIVTAIVILSCSWE